MSAPELKFSIQNISPKPTGDNDEIHKLSPRHRNTGWSELGQGELQNYGLNIKLASLFAETTFTVQTHPLLEATHWHWCRQPSCL